MNGYRYLIGTRFFFQVGYAARNNLVTLRVIVRVRCAQKSGKI